MLAQPTFWESPGRTLREKFDRYHTDNPHVYDLLVRMARQAQQAGHKRYGMKSLFEVMRWKMTVETSGDSFKLNNNYTAFYARKVMAEYPELDGFFALREQKPSTQTEWCGID